MTDTAVPPGPFDTHVPPGASGPTPAQERILLDEMAARGIRPELKDAATEAAIMSFEHFPAAEHLGVYNGTPHGASGDPVTLAFDTRARGWLHAAGLPRETGSSLLEAAHKFNQTATRAPISHEQQMLNRRTTEAMLQRMLGDRFETTVRDANAVVDRIEAKRPGFINWLACSGAGNNPTFITSLAFQAEVLKARGYI